MDETTGHLAAFGSGLSSREIPDDVAARVKTLFGDAVASALSGWTSPQSHQMAATATRLYGGGEATVIGRGTTSPAAAALVNGYLTTARSVCDVHQPTLCHVTPVVAPAVIGLAERDGVSGEELLVALAAGMEVTVRVGLGLDYPKFRARGWHSPGVSGLIGASVGAARVLGLDAASTEQVMGIAGAQAGGTFASYGTPTIKFHQARSAQAAILAATLVEESFQGPLGILTNPDGGVFTTFSDGGDPAKALGGLGERWELMEITTRLWPAAAALQSILTIVDEDEVPRPDDDLIDVEVALPPKSYEMNAEMGWDTLFEATLSARFATSLVLHGGDFWALSGEVLRDPRIGGFARDHITVVEDTSMAEGAARLTSRTQSGEVTRERLYPRGSPLAPASWDDISAKMHVTGDPLLGEERVDAVLDMIADLESVSDVATLLSETRAVNGD